MLLLPREMYLCAGDGNKLRHDLKMQLEKEAVPLRALCTSTVCIYMYIVFIHCPSSIWIEKQEIIAKQQKTQTSQVNL